MTTHRRRTAALLPAIGMLAALLGVAAVSAPEPASAQAMLRNQTRITNDAIRRQVQNALRPLLVVRNTIGPVLAMETSADGRRAAFAFADGVRVWDLENGLQIGVVPATGLRALAIAGGTRTLATADATGTVTLWDAGTGTALRRLTGAGAVDTLTLSADGSLVAAAGADGRVRLWNTADGRSLPTPAGAGAVAALAFSPSGARLAAGGADGTVRLIDTANGAVAGTLSTDGAALTRLAFADEATLAGGGADGRVRVWRGGRASPERTMRAGDGPVRTLAVRPDGTVAAGSAGQPVTVWDARGARLSSAGAADFAGFPAVGERLLTAGADGRGRLWDARSGAAVGQMIMTRGGWSVVDGAGRYDGSDGGVADIARQADQELYEMPSFAEPYYEPGLLAKLLRAPNQMLTANAPPVEAGIAPPPVVELAAPSGGAVGPAQVTVTATDRGGGLETVILYLNGKAVGPARLTASRDETRGGQPVRVLTYTVDLVAGTNRLRAMALGGNRIESLPAEATVPVSAPPGAPPPTLHLVVVGINQYANPALALNYAVADARGLTGWGKAGAKPIFGAVKLYELYDRQATRPNIQRLFAQLESTRPEDVVMVYYAGHGETANDTWHMLPTEFGRGVPFELAASDGRSVTAFRDALVKSVTADGIPASELRDQILRIGAQRVLVLIDACKSGALNRAFDGFADRKHLQTLSQQSGIHILAATAKEQLAVEIEQLGHGAFTYAVLQALQGAADRSPADGVVTARELLDNAVAQVPIFAFRYANSEQFPTVFSRGADFAVGPATKKPVKAKK
ncbi:hypothetical protein HL658_00715 [Azospirillum sp. RWY-5-1]|uniref:Peptidase C14 caspase domain-containing protein n=1 Tax=Azospirillum oleiclasticum TaxID=2735135 RepID=A0ABX2T4L2_9PROT|nr:hypothetical protein [Azospirillum oleiclasticum]NYZ18216.1 hypothetical protein [Azospirillum oleiclasticum]